MTVDDAIDEFMTSLWQAVAIILAVSFISLGIRPGLVVALSIPLTLAVVFAVMQIGGIDMQRISLGALIIALALLVDDAMTTTDAMLSRLAAGDDKEKAATYAFSRYAFAMLAGTLVTIAGFVPIGFAAWSAGEYTFSLFAVVGDRADRVVVRRGDLLAAARPVDPASRRQAAARQQARAGDARCTAACSRGAIAVRWLTHRRDGRPVRAVAARHAADPAAVLPGLRPAGTARRPAAAAERLDLRQRGRGRNASTRRCRAIRDVERWSTYVGRGAIRFYLPLNAQLPNDFFSQAVIVAKDVDARERLQREAGEAAGRASSRTSSRASIRWNSVRRSAGRCSTA